MLNSDIYRDRQLVIQATFICVATVLILRAGYMQLLDSSFRVKAEAITIDKAVTYPSRGLVFDRKGDLMVYNQTVYDLMVAYNQIDPKMDTAKFCRLLGIDTSYFRTTLEKDFKHNKRYSRNVPFLFMPRISAESYAKFQESLYQFPGFYVQIRNIRDYETSAGAAVLGYISEVTQQQIDKFGGIYETGDYIGSGGLELSYESVLRGKKGIQYILKDNLGRSVGRYRDGKIDSVAVSGRDIISSLDLDVQDYAEQLMANKRGSVIAIEPKTGEIICMVSAPTYDIKTMTINPKRGNYFASLLADSTKPLFNRATLAQYPPGSIFKPLVALIGMQEGVWGAENGVSCGGAYYYGHHRWGCHRHGGVGNVPSAIQYSCNTYFFTCFRNIIDKFGFSNSGQGLDVFNGYLYKFGLGNKLGIDLPSERKGNVPTTAFYDRVYPKKRGGWRSPTIISLGIGQGEMELTSIQMANLAAMLANRGYYYTPHVLKAYADGTPIDAKYRVKHQSGIAPEHYASVIAGLQGAVLNGTARGAQIVGITVAGKTGTSQNSNGDDHSVFYAFAPVEDPKIAIAVFVENGGWGADYAVPIASLVMEKYLKGSTNRKAVEERLAGAVRANTKRNTRIRLQSLQPTQPPQN